VRLERGHDRQGVTVAGADLTIAWTPADNFRGWPFLKIETEVMHRDFKADEAVLDHGDGDVDTLLLDDGMQYLDLAHGIGELEIRLG